MIRPVINEIFSATNIAFRNRYVNDAKKAYFINKLYSTGIQNIEIGSFNKDDASVYNPINIINHINTPINIGSYVNNKSSIGFYKNIPINKLIFTIFSDEHDNSRIKGLSLNQSIERFNHHKSVCKQLGISSKLIVNGNNHTNLQYIYNETTPDEIEVSLISGVVKKVIPENIVSLRVLNDDYENIDKALINGITRFSSSMLNNYENMDTIKLINYLKTKLNIQLDVRVTGLKEIQQELLEEFM